MQDQGNLRRIKSIGRPEKFNARDPRSVRRSAKDNPENSIARIGFEAGLFGSHETFVIDRARSDLKSFFKFNRLKLTAAQKCKRLLWAFDH